MLQPRWANRCGFLQASNALWSGMSPGEAHPCHSHRNLKKYFRGFFSVKNAICTISISVLLSHFKSKTSEIYHVHFYAWPLLWNCHLSSALWQMIIFFLFKYWLLFQVTSWMFILNFLSIDIIQLLAFYFTFKQLFPIEKLMPQLYFVFLRKLKIIYFWSLWYHCFREYLNKRLPFECRYLRDTSCSFNYQYN